MGEQIMSIPKGKRLLILHLLEKEEMYGHAMKIEEPSLKQGTLYVTLHRLTQEGYLTYRDEKVPGQPGLPRRYYAITPAGRRALRAAHAAARSLGRPLLEGAR
jgi:DNA-binding PadR family transcriptional regulator